MFIIVLLNPFFILLIILKKVKPRIIWSKLLNKNFLNFQLWLFKHQIYEFYLFKFILFKLNRIKLILNFGFTHLQVVSDVWRFMLQIYLNHLFLFGNKLRTFIFWKNFFNFQLTRSNTNYYWTGNSRGLKRWVDFLFCSFSIISIYHNKSILIYHFDMFGHLMSINYKS